MNDVLSGVFFGLLLGVRHALEPDHLVAVSTLVVDRGMSRRGALLGAAWGLGHTLALLAVAAVLALLRRQMPAGLADGFEFAVGLMLIGLGATTLRGAFQQGRQGPVAPHAHGPRHHTHAGVRDHIHVGRWPLARRPLLVGVVHGLAGSGALTAMVLAQLSSPLAQLTYVLLFGLGSIASMALLSGLVGLPLARLGRRPTLIRSLSAVAGLGSIGLGLAWGLPYARHWLM